MRRAIIWLEKVRNVVLLVESSGVEVCREK